jgi:hypothetical protein
VLDNGLARAAIKTLKEEVDNIFCASDWATRKSNPCHRPGKRRTLFSPPALEKCFFNEVKKRLGVSLSLSLDSSSYFACMYLVIETQFKLLLDERRKKSEYERVGKASLSGRPMPMWIEKTGLAANSSKKRGGGL